MTYYNADLPDGGREPKDKLRDPASPAIRGNHRPIPEARKSGSQSQRERELVQGSVILALITGFSGFVTGAGVVGALVAIF